MFSICASNVVLPGFVWFSLINKMDCSSKNVGFFSLIRMAVWSGPNLCARHPKKICMVSSSSMITFMELEWVTQAFNSKSVVQNQHFSCWTLFNSRWSWNFLVVALSANIFLSFSHGFLVSPRLLCRRACDHVLEVAKHYVTLLAAHSRFKQFACVGSDCVYSVPWYNSNIHVRQSISAYCIPKMRSCYDRASL